MDMDVDAAGSNNFPSPAITSVPGPIMMLTFAALRIAGFPMPAISRPNSDIAFTIPSDPELARW